MDNYKIIKKIGEGTYGEVFLAIDKETNEKVALKKLKVTKNEVGISFSIIREISLLQELDHPNIVKIIRVGVYKKEVFIAYELMPSDLEKIIGNKDIVFNEGMIKAYMKMILSALSYLHDNYILHRV